MSKIQPHDRIPGLDTLRAAAIILVFMYHYMVFISNKPTFGFLGSIGWVGVDLFFVLSGYLIGHQIFSAIANKRTFSFKIFYYRRFLRTLPNYLFILGLYFLIPGFREQPLLPPLWKFITFTQNFGLQTGTSFSHAWSLCIEEQFYLILPIFALIIVYKKLTQSGWIVLLSLLIAGMILRGFLWVYINQHSIEDFKRLYYIKIYYSSFCRLDELVLGVGIAMLRNFHKNIYIKMMKKGNLYLLLGILGSGFTLYGFYKYHYSLLMTVIGYPSLALSFAALTIAALSPNTHLHQIKIPGTTTLAAWSYAIYLVHKPLSVIAYTQLSIFGIDASSFLTISTIVLVNLIGGGLIYTYIETPFLRIRDRLKPSVNIIPTSAVVN